MDYLLKECIFLEQELKLALGKLLGEVYRSQKTQGILQISEGRLFGLLNGVEEEIDNELENMKFISKGHVSVVCDALDPYYKGEKAIDEMPSFLHFRMELEHKGINHAMLIDILKYLRSIGSYTTEIDKLGNYKLNDYDV